jgi:hypothetical protein
MLRNVAYWPNSGHIAVGRGMSASDVLVDSTHNYVDARQACSGQVVRTSIRDAVGEHAPLLASTRNKLVDGLRYELHHS